MVTNSVINCPQGVCKVIADCNLPLNPTPSPLLCLRQQVSANAELLAQ